MAELTSQHTGQTVEQVTRDSDRDRWFDAFEAKEYGLIDDVIPTAAGDAGRRRYRGGLRAEDGSRATGAPRSPWSPPGSP